jgi:hypothetical protein
MHDSGDNYLDARRKDGSKFPVRNKLRLPLIKTDDTV